MTFVQQPHARISTRDETCARSMSSRTPLKLLSGTTEFRDPVSHSCVRCERRWLLTKVELDDGECDDVEPLECRRMN